MYQSLSREVVRGPRSLGEIESLERVQPPLSPSAEASETKKDVDRLKRPRGLSPMNQVRDFLVLQTNLANLAHFT